MKFILTLLFFSLLTPVFAQDIELDLEIYPKAFIELRPDPEDESSMFVGIRWSIVNPNPQEIKKVTIESFELDSETRGKVVKSDLGASAWKHIPFITLDPYKSFPYLDAVLVFNKNTLDRYNEGKETLNIKMSISYQDSAENRYTKDFDWKYSNKKFK